MSYVSTYYDQMVARIIAVLPEASGWFRLPNAYNPEANNDQILRQGWGLAVGAGSNAHSELSSYLTITRTLSLVICREVFKTDHDTSGISTVEKTLLGDLRLIAKDFETNQTLNNGSGTGFCSYEDDAGIEFLKDGAFMAIKANFTIKFRENIS